MNRKKIIVLWKQKVLLKYNGCFPCPSNFHCALGLSLFIGTQIPSVNIEKDVQKHSFYFLFPVYQPITNSTNANMNIITIIPQYLRGDGPKGPLPYQILGCSSDFYNTAYLPTTYTPPPLHFKISLDY